MSRPVRIIVGIDDNKEHERYAEAIERKINGGVNVRYSLEDLGRHDWIEKAKASDVIIWHPRYMGPRIASHFKEKVYFLEQHLGKIVLPRFSSMWHFESKIAQSYIFSHYGVPTPATTVTFAYQEAIDLLRRASMPLVFKAPFGSGSQNVWLVSTQRRGMRELSRIFADQFWYDAEKKYGEGFRAAIHSWKHRWFWEYLLSKLRGDVEPGAAYWQEFIAGNDADLRITVIGERYAFGFWRHNRPGDFRASGSGLIDYDKPVPEDQVKYCLKINRDLQFDSMAYDVLFTSDKFVINEMSYGFLDKAIYNARGHYELSETGSLGYKTGHIWPQELIVEWALQRAARELPAA